MIGMNSYWKMTDDARSNAEAVTSMTSSSTGARFRRTCCRSMKKIGKPLMFLEIGWFSQAERRVRAVGLHQKP